MRVPFADRLVAPDKYDGIGWRKLSGSVGHSVGKMEDCVSVCRCVLNRFILAGIYFSSCTPLDNEKIAKRTPTVVTPPPLIYLHEN